MIRFKKYQNTNPCSSCYGKWFGRAVHELVEFEDFVEHMAKHHCVFSEVTIRGVLIEMEVCLRELLLEGKAVRFDELGIFRIGLKTRGRNREADFTANDVEGVRLNLHLGRRFRAADLFNDAKIREAEKYAVGVVFDDEGGNGGGGSDDPIEERP